MSNHSRRWFQLSLTSLFLLTLLVATFFAGYSLATKQAERERRQAELEAQRQAEEARRLWVDHIVTGPGGGGYMVGDFDSDGKVDLFVANKQSPPQVLRNLGNGKFQDVSGAGR